MKILKVLPLLAAAGCFMLPFQSTLYGQPNASKPASLLLFPYFSAKRADVNIISITNTHRDTNPGPGGQQVGRVKIHFHYIDLVEGGGSAGSDDDVCMGINNMWRELSPADTFSVLVSAHNSSGNEGFLYVVAEDLETGKPIDFDYLVGEALLISPGLNFMWSVPAYGFRALSENDLAQYPNEKSSGGHLFTDLAVNGGLEDGEISFTGDRRPEEEVHEYQAWPDELYLNSFWEQTGGFLSFLILLSPLSSDWRTQINIFYYNDAEVELSQTRKIRCWIKQPLTYFMPGAGNFIDGPGVFGVPDRQIGWARIITEEAVNTEEMNPRMDHPPLLGMILRTVGGMNSPFKGSTLLAHKGVLDPSNTNWDFTFNGGVRE